MAGLYNATIQILDNCDTEIDVFSACQKFSETCGYSYFSVLKYPEEHHHNLYDIVLTANWPVSLIKSYDKAGLLDGSPFADHLKETERPFLWTAKEMYDSRTPESEKNGRALFEQCKMSHGVGFKVQNSDGVNGFVIFTSDKDLRNDTEFEEIQAVASYIFSKMVDVYEVDTHPDSKLSKRENECLIWTSEGKTSYEIGMILGLSENTINNYLVTVGRKLGAVNRPHMVGIALRKGYI